MRHSFLAILFLLVASASFAQTPSAVEREFVGYLDNISKYGNYNGGYDDAKLAKNNADLRDKLLKYGKRADILKFNFPGLKDKMYVTTSKDGRLRIYSWDLETGGTMHDFASVFQYRGKSGKVYSWTEKREDESAGVFYHQIFQTDTTGGPIYLGVSTFIGSTSLAGQTIKAFRINGEKLDVDAKVIRTASGIKNSVGFAFDFFTVVDHPERPVRLFSYNEANKSFRFPVVIEDKRTPQGRVTSKFITYRFDGKYFVKVS
ncbi:MAG TPA: hypothetical protein PLL77_15205 [Pyrinomonadaceae bacterium]|nr:hypothetical protein [Pyrinomonadaceae bacterium]